MHFSINYSLTLQEIKNIARLCARNGSYDAFFEKGAFPFPCFFLALEGGETAAFLSILPWNGLGEITAVTDAPFRRQGIFSHLLSLAHEANPDLPLVGAFPRAFDLSESSLCRGLSHREYWLSLNRLPESLPARENEPGLSVISPRQNTYFLLKEQRQIGEAHLAEETSFTNLWGVEIKEPYRRMGYGSKLISSVIRDYFSRRQKPLVLHVSSTNTGACRLYEKLGFIPAETISYYSL